MQRDLERLENTRYDVLVIGGGIHGACIAWDAALRGLSVALVDKGDFGHVTSANSLKIIHGGLRYLQDGNLRLVRLMIQERTNWMRIAPHLVHPLTCVMPTTHKLTRSKLALTVALRINDLLSYDRNRLTDPQKFLPNGRPISRSECLRLLPGLEADGITGGAIWYDAQMYNSERLLLAFILSAAQTGGHVANYVEVTDFLEDERGVNGVKAKDVLTGGELEIRAKLVVNCVGAWVDAVLGSLNDDLAPRYQSSVALNLVTRQIAPTHAIGIPSQYAVRERDGHLRDRSRLLFVVPWHGYSLVGTGHIPYDGPPEDYRVTEETIEGFVDEINAAYPGAALTREDVYHVHQGFLPVVDSDFPMNTADLVRRARVHDHEPEDGLSGLITVVGVKYTTARYVAQKVIDLALRKLGREVSPCRTQDTPICGGRIYRFDDFLAQAMTRRLPETSDEVMQHLVYSYGSEYPQILRYLDEEPTWGQTISPAFPVVEAEVVHAVREEMAQKLSDVVQRRTELGAAGLPDETCLRTCADLMAAELGWDQARKDKELDELRGAYIPTTAPISVGMGEE